MHLLANLYYFRPVSEESMHLCMKMTSTMDWKGKAMHVYSDPLFQIKHYLFNWHILAGTRRSAAEGGGERG